MAWDRYAGLGNNPIRYKDPNGHEICDADGYCGKLNDYESPKKIDVISNEEKYWKDLLEANFGVTLLIGNKSWGEINIRKIFYALSKITRILRVSIKSLTNGVSFKLNEHIQSGEDDISTYSGEVVGNSANFTTTGNENLRTHHFFHEFGHILDNISTETSDKYTSILGETPYYANGEYVFGGTGIDNINQNALKSTTINGTEAIQHQSDDPNEQWADVFANYISGNIDTSVPEGQIIYEWVTAVLAYP